MLCHQIFLQVYILHFKKQYKIIQGNCPHNDVDRDKIKSKKYLTIDRWLISIKKKRKNDTIRILVKRNRKNQYLSQSIS